jgi:hypothetical protein
MKYNNPIMKMHKLKFRLRLEESGIKIGNQKN